MAAGKLNHPGLRALVIVLIIASVIAFWVLRPIRETNFQITGYTPLRDDAVAAKYAPVILPHPLHGSATRLLYRMAKNSAGETLIAYHAFYADEHNTHSGFGARMSRLIYTGGLNLKNIMFGPADLELIEVTLDRQGKPVMVWYEDAENYNPAAFSVRHSPKSVKNPALPLCFRVPTWNHMFALETPAACMGHKAMKPEYFNEADWNHYRMVKKTEAILRRNRTHRDYERIAVP